MLSATGNKKTFEDTEHVKTGRGMQQISKEWTKITRFLYSLLVRPHH